MQSKLLHFFQKNHSSNHSCFNDTSQPLPRLHLPVALKCNIKCKYCERVISNSNEICPGHTKEVITPDAAFQKAKDFIDKYGEDVIIGIAGPGDPCENKETFTTFQKIRDTFKQVKLCLCTNGLKLIEYIPLLKNLSINHLSITLNTLNPETAKRIYARINIDENEQSKGNPFDYFIQQQIAGIEEAVKQNIVVKVNTVYIPGINNNEIIDLSKYLSKIPVSVHNIIPLVPKGEFKHIKRPDNDELNTLRKKCNQYINTFSKCKQCRADCIDIPEKKVSVDRRFWLKASGFALASGLLSHATPNTGASFNGKSLAVWSCGGLAEAFIPANKEYEEMTGCKINYTGAFAAALGKSLLGNAETEVFAPRVLELAKKLKKAEKMVSYSPLCFTQYLIVVPVDNPANIKGIHDLKREGVRVLLSVNASPPGGKAVLGILKKAGIIKMVLKNTVFKGDCVQTDIPLLIKGKADVAIVEKRVTMLPQFKDKLKTISIPEKIIPAMPIPFTIGMMKYAQNREMANHYIEFICSEKGQQHFHNAGFITAMSNEGKRLISKYGVA